MGRTSSICKQLMDTAGIGSEQVVRLLHDEVVFDCGKTEASQRCHVCGEERRSFHTLMTHFHQKHPKHWKFPQPPPVIEIPEMVERLYDALDKLGIVIEKDVHLELFLLAP